MVSLNIGKGRGLFIFEYKSPVKVVFTYRGRGGEYDIDMALHNTHIINIAYTGHHKALYYYVHR